MASIQTQTNELLPKLKLTNLILGQLDAQNKDVVDVLKDTKNLFIEASFNIENKITTLDQFIKDEEYYKYVKVTFSIPDSDFIENAKLFNNNEIQLSNKLILKNINLDTFSIKLEETFDFDSFAKDNNISDSQLILIKEIYGKSEYIIYPILKDSKIVVLEQPSESILVDQRILDGLKNVSVSIKSIPTKAKKYFDIYSTHNSINLTNFVVFNYSDFLTDTSYFPQDALDNYSYFFDISNNGTVVDSISITKNQTSESFTSLNSNSVLHYKNKNIIVFSFNENMSLTSSKIKNLYDIKITNKDQTFINFYNKIFP